MLLFFEKITTTMSYLDNWLHTIYSKNLLALRINLLYWLFFYVTDLDISKSER